MARTLFGLGNDLKEVFYKTKISCDLVGDWRVWRAIWV